MVTLSRFRLPFITQCLLCLIPVNIYVIGDGLAAGIQCAFFRYQQSYVGNSLIFFSKDLYYIREGWITGHSALAAELATAASLLLMVSIIICLYVGLEESATFVKAGALITLLVGCLFLLSDLLQYGLSFHGPAGFTIPIGVPVILVCGWWMYRMKFPEIENAGSDDKAVSEKNETFDD
jgi:hypothetical protein